MEKSFKSVIDQSRSILVLLPKDPNFDQVAAALSLYLAVEGKKDIAVSCPTQMQVQFNRLVGVDKIEEEIGSKNMVLRFEGYAAENIERVSYDIENQEFKLTVIPKPQNEPPKKEQLKVNYSGVSADTTVLVGGTKAEDFPALAGNELTETKIVHIGISDVTPPEGRNIISLARPSSSISEIMADYIRELEGGFHPDIATNLLSGIHEGSSNFSKKEVNSNTFKLASDLMNAGGKYTRKEEFKPEKPQFSFPPQLMQQMQAMQNKRPMLQNPKAMDGATKQDDQSPEKATNEAPEGESVKPPKEWLKQPKIYSGNKGTSVS
jgi:hypothetical protein